jgi:hypothetical protein
MRRKFLLTCLAIVLGLIVWAPVADALSNQTATIVPDLSWPNCAVATAGGPSSGIIGVDGGLDFHPNPCLSSETKLFTSYALYLNTGYPGPAYAEKYADSPLACNQTDYLCLAYNYGYHAAEYSIGYANTQSAHSFMWWLDVETSNSWTNNVLQNQAALTGMIAAIKKDTLLPNIGFYSYPGQWNLITGDWHNGYPVWVATGSTSPALAISFCSDENFTGGSTWLSQYTPNLDQNYICSPTYSQHLKPR